ncbi:MAG: glycosyltransferase [Acidimicrobiia bacterium]
MRALFRGSRSRAESELPLGESAPRGQDTTSAAPARYPVTVSVIMPVYNKGRGVFEAIDSVKRQTLQDFEIVVWDDGSTDEETLEAIDEIRQFDHVQVHTASNQGVVGARNSAMSVARGEFFCCLDPDDELSPTYLEKAVAVLRSGEADIVYPWQQTVGTRNVLWRTHDLDPRRILKYNHVPVCAVFHRKVFTDTGGFSAAMSGGYEDWELWAHAAELGFVGKVIPEPLFQYTFDESEAASRDATARRNHDALVATIAELHPRLRGGTPAPRPASMRAPAPTGRPASRFEPGVAPSILMTLPWFTVGGADQVVETLVRQWTVEGRTVVVFTTLPLGRDMQDRVPDLLEATPYVYNLPTMGDREDWLGFASATLASLADPTFINVGSPWFFTAAVELKNRHHDVRFIDQQFNDVGHLEGNREAKAAIDVTVAAYDGLAATLRSDGRPPESVKTIYVGIETALRPDPDVVSQFRQSLEVGSAPLVAFIGRMAPEKRPEWVPRLADALTGEDARFLIVGDGPLAAELRPDIEARQRVHWLEHVEKIEVALAAADLIILPSRIEGIPLVAMEALAIGTPVIATRVGGLPDLDGPGISLVDPDDFDAFAMGVKAALSHPSEDVALPAKFTASTMLAQWAQIIRN